MSVTSGIGHFFQAIFETITGIFNGIFNLFAGLVRMVMDLINAFVGFVEGTLGFVFHNFMLIVFLIAAVFVYLVYTQRSGRAPISEAMTGKKLK